MTGWHRGTLFPRERKKKRNSPKKTREVHTFLREAKPRKKKESMSWQLFAGSRWLNFCRGTRSRSHNISDLIAIGPLRAVHNSELSHGASGESILFFFSFLFSLSTYLYLHISLPSYLPAREVQDNIGICKKIIYVRNFCHGSLYTPESVSYFA